MLWPESLIIKSLPCKHEHIKLELRSVSMTLSEYSTKVGLVCLTIFVHIPYIHPVLGCQASQQCKSLHFLSNM